MHAAGRRFVHVVLLGCTLRGLASLAIGADNYPSRPVTIVVPFTPGASTDTLARFEADVLQRALHQSFVVENRPGAGGEVGIAYAAKAAPDGYTLLHAPSVITLLPYLKKSISYNPADFNPVVLVGLTQFGLVVSPSLPVNSVQDLIALAKEKSGTLTYASAGIGTPHQIFAELFKTKTGVDHPTCSLQGHSESASSHNRTPRSNSAPSSLRKARNGARSSVPPALSCSELRIPSVSGPRVGSNLGARCKREPQRD
jgi:tripartite-type tricarboxylate transporter receptor subunit TctC